jgi:hypothetical protein
MMSIVRISGAVVLATAFTVMGSTAVRAHCDTMGGPVIAKAQEALETGDVTPVLKWVKPEYEQQIRTLFDKTLIVRKEGPEAREVADMHFFETLVRLHREGEGAAYTGLKPAGEVEPIVQLSDQALESGNVDALIEKVTEVTVQGIRERFEQVVEARQHMDESVEAGRRFVEAYVTFTHYVEKIHEAAEASPSHEEH